MARKPEMLGETLTRHYRLSCELFSTYPVPHFTHQLSQGNLDLRLDNVDLDHLEALCHTLKNKVSPLSLRIIVPTGKEGEVYPMMAKVVERAVEGVGVCVVASLTLTSLALDGVRLRGRTLKLLCEGLRKARTLKTLIMRNCGLGDSGTESVCQAVKNVPSITQLSLVNCGVAERGATSLACLIKHQRLNRDSAMWQDTLRQRQPHLDSMKGLRRLTLNSNPALGDQGVAAIAEALTEDLWVKAVDLQHCGVGLDGGASFHALLHTNQTLEVVDLRNNPFLPDSFVGELTILLQGRCSEVDSQYSWLKASEVENEAVVDRQKGGGTVGYRASGRVMRARRGRQCLHVPVSRRPKPPSQLGVPWRVEHRLYERREGLAPGSMVKECIRDRESFGEASQPSRESIPEGDLNMKMRKKLQLYKKKYQKEREHRQKLERKLSRIQTQLQGLHTLDETTVSHIEECFLKFHIFLSMMKTSGEEVQPSSGTVSPSHHPPVEPGSSQTHPGSIFLPGTLPSLPPSTVPVPVVIHQPFHESTSHSHPISEPHSLDSREGNNVVAEKTVSEAKLSVKNKDETMNQEILRIERNVKAMSQGCTSHGSESEMQRKDDSRVRSEIMASSQHRKSPSGSMQGQLKNKKNTDERIMPDFINGKYDKGMDEGRVTKIKKSKEKKENMNITENDTVPTHAASTPVKEKEKHTVATQVDSTRGWSLREVKKTVTEQELINPSNADSIAMRMEFRDDERRGYSEELSNEKIKYTDGINGKKIHSAREDEELEGKISSKELSPEMSKTKETHTLQGLMEGNVHEGGKSLEKASPIKTKSQGSGASLSPSHSPLASQSYHPTQSSSSHFLKESQSLQQSPLPLSHLLQEDPTSPNQFRGQLYQQIPSYQDSQSPLSQSSASHSPPNHSPQESRPLEKIQSPQKVTSPQNWPPKKSHQMQRSKSPQKQSPKRNRSPRKEPPGVQGSEVSETDDEKMRNLSVWLQGRTKGRASTHSSSSSVSISEHLQQSHSSWTKSQSRRKGGRVEEEGEVEELPGGSEIDLSDFEDFSLSGITLTNTSVPEDIQTPGEEDF